MQILFILLPKSKKNQITEHWSHRKHEKGKFIQHFVLMVQPEMGDAGKKKKNHCLAKQNKLQKRKTEQAEIWHILVTPAS